MIPDKLSVNDALRYFFCGAIFILAFAFGYNCNFSELKTLITSLGVEIGLVALLAGVIIYTIYRALFFVWIYRITELITSRCWPLSWSWLKLLLPWLLLPSEFKQIKWLWTSGLQTRKQKSQSNNKGEAIKAGLAEWSSQIHFCYTATLGIWAGSYFGVLISGKTAEVDFRLLGIASLFLFAGGFSHLRLKSLELQLGKPKFGINN